MDAASYKISQLKMSATIYFRTGPNPKEYYLLPKEVFQVYRESSPDSKLEALVRQYTWLQELEPDYRLGSFPKSRAAFLEDGYTFMSALKEYLNTRKWHEFVLQACVEDEHGVLMQLLSYVSAKIDEEGHHLTPDFPALRKDEDILDAFKVAHEEQELRKKFFDAFKTRCHDNANVKLSRGAECSLLIDEIVNGLRAKVGGEKEDIESTIKDFCNHTSHINSLKVERLGFDASSINGPLGASSNWRRIGQSLSEVAQLVGAKQVQKGRTGDLEFLSLVEALEAVIDSQGPVTSRMLAQIEVQNVTIQEQQQAITALQFRHLLENIPAGKGATATARWCQFWNDAVTKAYNEHETPTGHKPSPLTGLLQPLFDKADKLKEKDGTPKTKADRIHWLVDETGASQRARSLYGTLSDVIHHYRPGEFLANPLNWSPDDARLLNTLAPEASNIIDGTVKWDKERDRYIW